MKNGKRILCFLLIFACIAHGMIAFSEDSPIGAEQNTATVSDTVVVGTPAPTEAPLSESIPFIEATVASDEELPAPPLSESVAPTDTPLPINTETAQSDPTVTSTEEVSSETLTPTPVPTSTSTSFTTPAPTLSDGLIPFLPLPEDAEETPLPLPAIKKISFDQQQAVEGFAQIHISVEQAEGDTRPIELILVLALDGTIHDAEEYLTSHPLEADAFDPENLLQIDPADSKQRYAAEVPHHTRFIVVGRVEGQLFHSAIHPGFSAEQSTEAPPQDTPEPPPADSLPEPEEEIAVGDGEVYITPKDEDGDGYFSRTEYRLGLNPYMRDTYGEGDGDFMSVYMQGRLGKDRAVMLWEMNDPKSVRPLIDVGLLGEPLTAKNPEWAVRKFKKSWTSGGPALIGFWDKASTRFVCLNNYGIFTGSFQFGREFRLDNIMYLSVMAYPAVNKHRFARCLDTTADGSIALLYDRMITEESGKGGGALRADAMLIDTVNMTAYPISGTEGAKDVALSLDGMLLAIWREDRLDISNLLTGASVSITESSELSRVEMLSFTKDNQLVVRVTQMGFSAFALDGSMTLGSVNELGVFIRSRDMLGFDVYDKDHLLLRVDAKLFLASNGIYVTGEDEKARRILSVDDVLKIHRE